MLKAFPGNTSDYFVLNLGQVSVGMNFGGLPDESYIAYEIFAQINTDFSPMMADFCKCFQL